MKQSEAENEKSFVDTLEVLRIPAVKDEETIEFLSFTPYTLWIIVVGIIWYNIATMAVGVLLGMIWPCAAAETSNVDL